jgi:hypothetical protein
MGVKPAVTARCILDQAVFPVGCLEDASAGRGAMVLLTRPGAPVEEKGDAGVAPWEYLSGPSGDPISSLGVI